MTEEKTAGRLAVRTKIAYGVGDMGANLVISAVGFYYLYFLTDISLLAASLAGASLMLVRIVDAFTDPLIGYLSDRTHSRWGRRRPYLLFGSFGVGVGFFLLFTWVPIHNQTLLFLHATFSYLIFFISYSLVNIPYAALTPDMTQDFDERTNLTGYRMSCAIIGVFISAGATKPLVALFPSERMGFSIVAAAYGVIFVILTLIVFAGVRGKGDIPRKTVQAPMFRLYLSSFKNRPFLMTALTYIMVEMSIVVTSSTMIYFMKYYMKHEDLISFIFLDLLGMAIIFIPVWVLISKRIGKKMSYVFGIGIYSLAILATILLKPGQLIQMYILTGIAGIGVSTEFVCPWAMLPDTIEYNEYTSGERNEGIFYGMFSFGPKLSSAVAGLLVGAALSITHYVPNVAIQSKQAMTGIRMMFCIAPVLISLTGMLMMILYPISHKRYGEIVAELGVRRSAQP
jgi:glycoside/pentoside/hexuronide:cation symporter, GPH family